MALIEGKNSVIEALEGTRKIYKIYLQQGTDNKKISRIQKLAQKKDIPVEKITAAKIKQLAHSAVPQGVVAEGEELKNYKIEEILQQASDKNEPPLIVLLDHIQDPHNFGAILRSAYAVGAHGVIYPSDRAAGITPVVLKAAAGAAEHLALAQVANINYAIQKLKDEGLWVAGADITDASVCHQQDLKGSLALVIGSEGKGLSRLVRENCDFLVKIPMKQNLDSFNVSVAAGILLYEIMRQRDE